MRSTLSVFVFCVILNFPSAIKAQDPYAAYRKDWLAKAEASRPELTETIKHPTAIAKLVADNTAFQGWKTEPAGQISEFYSRPFKKQNGIVLDFGEHITGYVSFVLSAIGTADAPTRLKLTFGEVPSELATPFDPYPGGLSRAWLQDMVVDVVDVPAKVKIDRRLSFRYVKIELLGISGSFDFKFNDITCKAVTSASNKPDELPSKTPQVFKDIDRIGLNTLKECMQTVYEDGPKRDRRLWIGDLYLESLANTYSFKSHDLTKRCLYMLAGVSGENGYLVGTAFEHPEPHPQVGQYLMDYALLYNVALKEYLTATNDMQTANDLWPVAQKQLDIIHNYVQPDGMMNYEKANKEWWLFFDWKDGLNKQVALQGLSVYVLKQTYQLAEALHKQDELKDVPALIKKMTTAARQGLYNKQTGLFESGKDKQISYASQTWMVIAGVANKKEAQKALRTVVQTKGALYPGGPYLYHYYVQAQIEAGLYTEAKQTVADYWGGMVSKGADTFWEVYDPNNEKLSPYNFFPINSYCHAWSCTPVYFIRKYPEVFQKGE